MLSLLCSITRELNVALEEGGQTHRKVQPLDLASAEESGLEDGGLGVRMYFHGGLDLLVQMSPEMMGELKGALATIEEFSKPADPNKRKH